MDLEDVVLLGAAFFSVLGLEVFDLRAGLLEVFAGAVFLGFEAALEEDFLAGAFALTGWALLDTGAYSSESMATPSTIFGIGSDFLDGESL